MTPRSESPAPAAHDDGRHDGGAAAPVVLDARALAALARLDPSGSNHLVQRVLTTYLGSLARLVAQLALARKNDDPSALRLVTHTLKSSSASVGAMVLSSLCSAAEQAVREDRLDALPPLLDQLEAEAVRVDVAVRKLLSDPATTPR